MAVRNRYRDWTSPIEEAKRGRPLTKRGGSLNQAEQTFETSIALRELFSKAMPGPAPPRPARRLSFLGVFFLLWSVRRVFVTAEMRPLTIRLSRCRWSLQWALP